MPPSRAGYRVLVTAGAAAPVRPRFRQHPADHLPQPVAPRRSSPFEAARTLVDRTLDRTDTPGSGATADDSLDVPGLAPGLDDLVLSADPADAAPPVAEWAVPELAADAAALLGDLAAEEGNTPVAERYYRRIRDRWPSTAAGGGAEISLAEILVADGSEQALAEARQLLTAFHDRPGPKPDNQLFRWHLANLHLADRTGEDDAAREAAILALELAVRGRNAPSHQAEGTADTDPGTLRMLRERIGFRRRTDAD